MSGNGGRHTPGPWAVLGEGEDPSDSYYADWLQVGTAEQVVARVGCSYMRYQREFGDGSVNREANARLIAAAPDLLAALYEAATLLSALTGPDDAIAEAVLAEARAAIAKARGHE